ncbi:hypothetical protein MSAR_06550 [Mycolicibacterium sarraceniae]|uniref:Uncharacterized protein n=1 Tax=Mycolicibacterium sarraceniae TaxID=1534348 RepID=A0A7I7SMS6_9MYCO|nr:hypothetical protein MSAR_06550 [Mycolicibacterium sarraceniae]
MCIAVCRFPSPAVNIALSHTELIATRLTRPTRVGLGDEGVDQRFVGHVTSDQPDVVLDGTK